ncbi:MAG: glycosyltransferase [Clostridia bacterium]|nr:glycosyltransferase [Clostridia bacterium]
MSEIRIAQLVGNTSLGGVSNCVLNYWKYFDKEKFSFDFFTYGETDFDEKVKRIGGECHAIHDFRDPLKACSDLKRFLREERYDIVHSHLTSLSVFPLYVAKKEKIDVRIVHSHSTTDGKEKTAVIKNVLKRFADHYADARFACSVKSGEWLYGSKVFFLMPNAIDLDRFSFDPSARKALRNQYDIRGVCVGFAGRFEYQKGLFRFLDIAKEVSKRTESTAVLIGDGSQKEELKRYAEQNGIKAIFLPGCDEIERWYSAFDCLLMPSLYEGLPLVGIEAQSCGLPVFLSDAVTRECDFGGARFFARADEDLFSAISMCEGLRIDCREELISRGYEIRTAAKRLEQVYEDLVLNASKKKTDR